MANSRYQTIMAWCKIKNTYNLKHKLESFLIFTNKKLTFLSTIHTQYRHREIYILHTTIQQRLPVHCPQLKTQIVYDRRDTCN